ncbi:MAG: anti-sigma F factor antagonist [Tissierellia bacterium]|nr:anti-sigma F factor antagonist [Tissierellia bacterium]
MEIFEDSLIVKLKGELDHHAAEEIRKKIDNYYLANDLVNIILELSELTFMDSSGIGLIMGRYKITSENKGELILVCERESIKKILNMSGLLKMVKLYPRLDLAITNN